MYKHHFAPYMVMHVVYFLSTIVLHRSYIPFLPLRCNEPVGPLDEPTFPRDKYSQPDGFWRESARELFRAARQMMDLIITCQEREVLVETPLVGFAIYNAAFIGIYATHFPHMDQEGHFTTKVSPTEMSTFSNGQAQTQSRKSLDILRDMRQRLNLAVGWFRTLNRLHSYFTKVKKDFRKNTRRMDSNPPMDGLDNIRPVREGGMGGGLDEFRLLEKLFLDFGNIEDQISDLSGPSTDTNGQGHPIVDRGTVISDTSSNAVKSESDSVADLPGDGVGPRRESWVPVNTSPLNAGIPPGLEGDRQRSELDRRPSLPLPNSRSLQSPSLYSLPSLQHHIPVTLASTTAPGFQSLISPGSYNSPSTSQATSHYHPTSSNRLQPLGPWIGSHPQQPPPPPYSQSLPPITTSPSHGSSMLPPSGPATYTLPPALVAFEDITQPLSSVSLGGDDVVAFLDGGSYEQWPSFTDSEVGHTTGWLSAVWNQLP